MLVLNLHIKCLLQKVLNDYFLSFSLVLQFFRVLFHSLHLQVVQELKTKNFLSYENFLNVNDANSHFSGTLMEAINNVAPQRETRLKNKSEEWFDGEISSAIKIRNAKFKKFKKTIQLTDEEIFKESKYHVRNLIKNKKKVYL